MCRLRVQQMLLLAFLFILTIPSMNLLAQPQSSNETLVKPIEASHIQVNKTFEHYAAYWTSEPGWDTELQMKNNLAASPLTVTPVLRFASGLEIPLTPITIPSNASVSVSVNQGLREHSPLLQGRPDSFGSVVFRFASSNAMNLHAIAIPSLLGQPVTFRIQARPGWDIAESPRTSGTHILQGIWWIARSGLKDLLILSNSSNQQITGTLSLFDSSGKRWSERLPLLPHQSARISMNELVQTAGLSGIFGGVSFEVPAAVAAIDGIHLMYDEGGKFSGSLELFEQGPNATNTKSTASTTESVLRAPMLALRSPDPALGLPPQTSLQPTILVRNISAQSVSAHATLSWRSDSDKGEVKLPDLRIGPYATQQLEIWAMQKQLGIPDEAHWGLVSLNTTAPPDALIAIASSRDCTGVYNAETKFSSGSGGYFVGGEWRTDAIHNQIAAITNTGTQPTAALLTLHYDNGSKNTSYSKPSRPATRCG